MRKLLVVSLVAGALALGLLVPRGTAAPNLTDKPGRFEYAVLKFTRSAAPAAGQPGGVPAPTIWTAKVVWATADEEVEADGWADLATKLKAPAAKKEGSDLLHQLRAFNRLGADGWEVYEHERPAGGFGSTTESWLLKRRLP